MRVLVGTGAQARELWRIVPLECYLCAAAVFLAAGLKLLGLMA